MFFVTLYKQVTAMVMAAVFFAVMAWLPTCDATLMGSCSQVPGDTKCNHATATATGGEHGNQVLPYNNCHAFNPALYVVSICLDVRCEYCSQVNAAKGECVYFEPDKPIRCIVLG